MDQMPENNILLLIADDLGKQLGCYGCPYTLTPNIDKLASESVRFDKAFASTASCSGSRSTIYTGLHTHENGQYGLNSGKHHFMTFDHVETAPAILNRHRYLTGIVGKIHVGPEAVYPWTAREESFTRDVAWSSDRAAAFFQRAKQEESPFFLTVGYHDPHRDRTRGGFGNDEPVSSRISPVTYKSEDVVIPDFLTDTPGTRLELASYAEAVSRLDQGIGMILEELQAAGLADDTLVILMSDNGPPFINSKTTLFDAGICLPLLVRRPGVPSSVNSNLVSYVDILPTILDWAGVSDDGLAKSSLSGRSFLPVLSATARVPGWGHVFGSHTFHESTNYWPTRYIRTDRYKYHRNIAWKLDFPFANDIYGSLSWHDIRTANNGKGPRKIGQRVLKNYFSRPPEELYDLVEDPNEVHNLAGDASHKPVLEELRRRVEDWQRRTNDPWLFRDGVSVLLNKHHLDSGLEVTDQWELDLDGNGSVKYENLRFGQKGERS